MVPQWRAQLLADGVGNEAVRYAMVLLQAMFTLAIEWGEADANPVSVVRKPRQGRQRAIEPLTLEAIERLRRLFLDADDHRSATLVSERTRLRGPTPRRGTWPRMAPRPREHAPD